MTDPHLHTVLACRFGVFLLAGSIVLAPAPGGKAGEMPTRDSIEEQYRWNTDDLFTSDEEWEAAFAELQDMAGSVGAYRGRLGESSETLLEALHTWEDFIKKAELLYQYAHLKKDEDTRDNSYQGKLQQIIMLWVQFEQETAYMRPELLAIPEERMAEIAADPALADYGFYLEQINKMRPHTLSTEMEEVMAATYEVTSGPGEIFDMFTNADLQFPTITDADGNEVTVDNTTWYQLRSSPDRAVREAALEAFYGTYYTYRNSLAAMYATNVKADLFNFRTRGYDSSVHASLYPNDIPVDVYTNLVDTVRANLGPLHRYVAMKKRVLGLEEFHSHDVYAPLVPSVDVQYDYDTAVEMVLDAVSPLGKQYVADLQAGFDSRWVDVYQTEGKSSGAYCSTVYGMHPFVLLNYKGELEDVSTTAHEMGHAMHGYYSNETQPFIYHGHAIFVAEVASTTNELMMIQKMIDEAPSKEVKLYLLDFWANQIMNTVFRQTYFAEFELRAHEMAEAGQPLTADSMTEVYREIFQAYYGDELIFDGHLDMCWARIPHFYRSFYVYQYATSYAASMSLVKGFEEGNRKQRRARQEAYLGFLAAGESAYPIDVLREAGVDMTSPQPIQDTLEKFDWIVAEMEKLTAP